MQSVSARDNKADILKAFNDLQRQYKQAQAELNKLQKQPAPQSPVLRLPPVLQATDIAAVLSGLDGLRKGFGESSGELQARLTTEAERLKAVREELNTITAQLKAVHAVEPDDNTLDSLISTWSAQSERFEAELTEAREAVRVDKEKARVAWSVEKAAQTSRVSERDKDLARARSREQEEYAYDLERRRALEADTYQQEQRALQATLDELKARHEATWKAREAALAEREQELVELEAKVKAFPEEREKEVKIAKSIGANIANRQARIKADLLAREHKGLRQVYELKIGSMEASISEQSERLSALSSQLTTAQKRAQELAVKAIEGAANETSFQAIKEIALEQAKTPNKK